MDSKTRKPRAAGSEPEIPPEFLAAAEQIAKMYAPVFRALSKY